MADMLPTLDGSTTSYTPHMLRKPFKYAFRYVQAFLVLGYRNDKPEWNNSLCSIIIMGIFLR